MSTNRSSLLSCLRAAPLLLAAVMLAGCGGSTPGLPRASVRGTVTLDGTPLSEGTVRFVPAGETPGPKVSVVVTEGKFELEEANGPIVGSHRIEIESTDHGGFALDDETAFERLKVSGQKMIKVVRVPWIYNQRSILTADVTSDGPNEFTFALRTSQQSSVRRMPSGRR